MIALRKKDAVENRDVLYLECGCGCNILVLEYWKHDQTVSIWAHDSNCTQSCVDVDFLSFSKEESKRLLEAILSFKDAKEPLSYSFMITPPDEGIGLYFSIDNQGVIYEKDGVKLPEPIVSADQELSLSCFLREEDMKDALDPKTRSEDFKGSWGIMTLEEQTPILYEWAAGGVKHYETDNKS